MASNSLLTQSEIDDYITTNVIPSFMPLINKNLRSAIWGCDGSMIIGTNKLAHSMGFTDYKNMGRLSIKKLLLLADFSVFINKIPIIKSLYNLFGAKKEHDLAGLEIMNKLQSIRDEAFQTQTPINAVVIHPFQKIHETVLLVQHIPVFHPSGQIVAIHSYFRDFSMFGVHDYLLGYGNGTLAIPQKIMNINQLPFELTERQHEILFLQASGITQKDIASILNIHPGTVSKMINQVIGPKLGIDGANTKSLIEKAREFNLHKYIPPGLCKPWVIILHDKEEKEVN